MDSDQRNQIAQVEQLMLILGAKWKPAIMFVLVHDGPLRFNELRRRIPNVSQKMMTTRLRELERDGLISRVHHVEIPPRVEYNVTNLGRAADRVYATICQWGQVNMPAVRRSNKRYDAG